MERLLKIRIDFGASMNEAETKAALEQIRREHPEIEFGIMRVQFYENGEPSKPISPLGYAIYHVAVW